MSKLTRDGTAEPVSRDQILRHARGQGNVNFPCSADHEQDWQPYPVDPYSAICDDHIYMEDQCEWHRMTRMTGPDCVVMCNLINTYIHTDGVHSRESARTGPVVHKVVRGTGAAFPSPPWRN